MVILHMVLSVGFGHFEKLHQKAFVFRSKMTGFIQVGNILVIPFSDNAQWSHITNRNLSFAR